MEKEEKGFGFVVIILIWGGLLYFLFSTPLLSEFTGSKFLGSALLNFNSGLKEQKEIIGIFYDDNKENFQKAKIHFNKSIDIFDIKIFPENPELIFAGSNYGLFISRDGGLNWYNFSDLEKNITSNATVYKILFANGQSYISIFQNNKGIVYKSQDKFFSLEKIYEIEDEAVYDIAVNGNNLYLGLSNGRLLLYSLEKGEIRLLTTLNSAITDLKISRHNGGLIYLTLKSGGFWVSRNNGQSFERIKFLDDYRGANKINDFLVASLGNSSIYAATDYGLIKSSNSGETWQVFKSLPAEAPKISTLALKENPGEIFAASNGKIYKSRDYGLSWQIFDPGFTDRKISTINLEGNKIIIGTKK